MKMKMTNNTLPKALLLAEMIDSNEVCVDWDKDAVAELRRLHEVNQMLVETLDWLDTWLGDKPMVECSHRITKALAKAKEQA